MTAHIHLLTQCLGNRPTAYVDALQWEYKNDRDSHSPSVLTGTQSLDRLPRVQRENKNNLIHGKPPPVYLRAL